MQTDRELIDAYVLGDELSFKTIVERYTPSIFNFVARLAGRDNAPDITQDIFIKIWKHVKNFDASKASFKTWLFTIAKNTTVDFLRRKKSLSFSDMEMFGADETSFAEKIPDEQLLPDETLDKINDAKILNSVLEKIPEKYRAVLALHYQEDMTFDEIGTVLKSSTNTVKSQHRRALIILRKILADTEHFS